MGAPIDTAAHLCESSLHIPTNGWENSHILSQKEFAARVQAMVRALTKDAHLRKDLSQEALIHFWHQEKLHPGQKLSWYLESCRHHLQDFLRSGHSLDALKRSSLAVEITAAAEADETVQKQALQVQDCARSWAGAGDILAALAARLNPKQQAVLRHLSEGFRVQEIADSLGISHQAVTKAQQKILKVALSLELSS